MTWYEAKNACLALGGELLHLDKMTNRLNIQEFYDIRYLSTYMMWVARGDLRNYAVYRYSFYGRYFSTYVAYRFPGICKKCKYT